MVDEHEEESFAELFEQSLKQERRTVSPGEKVTGEVIQVGAERLILDLGGGLDGLLERSELDAEAEPKRGDRIEAYVVRIENRVAILAKTLGKGPAARRQLEESARTGIPVEGLVTGTNKGGFVVEIAGVRCFCPIGQMDLRRIDDPEEWVGQRLSFRVTEWRGERDVVLSRRVLLEEEQAEKAEQTRRRLEIGARFTGQVTGVRDFGAFVDIGGLEGLVPASELGWARSKPQDAVQVGQTVEVEVLDIQPPGPKDRSERITLSMRAVATDPWDELVQEVNEGTVVRGKVVRLQPFGAFVELIPGVDGLLHVSAFGKKIGHPADVVSVGDEIAVRLDAIDDSQRRISLSFIPESELASLEGAPQPAPVVEAPKGQPPKKPSLPAAGMKVRRASPREEEQKAEAPKAEPKPEPAPAPLGTKARILGRSTPATPAEGAMEQAPRVSRRPEDQAAPPVGTVLQVTVDRIETFGLFVTWGAGRGLLPASELELPKHSDLRKTFPVGTQLEAAVIEVRGDGKVRLSAKAAEQARERAEARDWMQSQKSAGGKGLGTLGDLLAKKLKK